MDSKVLQKLTAIKQKFRDLSPEEREKLGIALLKVNIGVNSTTDFELVKSFVGELGLEVKKDHLESFMNYLHSTSSNIPVELLNHSPLDAAHEAIEKQVSQKLRKSDLSTYSEDEIETLKDYPRPFQKG